MCSFPLPLRLHLLLLLPRPSSILLSPPPICPPSSPPSRLASSSTRSPVLALSPSSPPPTRPSLVCPSTPLTSFSTRRTSRSFRMCSPTTSLLVLCTRRI